jgi:polysaccharide export outer membrane protein
MVPIVYSISFRDPSGYFLATKMQMHNKDVVFAANAQSVEVAKVANFINTIVSVPNNIAATGGAIETWRIDSHIR